MEQKCIGVRVPTSPKICPVLCQEKVKLGSQVVIETQSGLEMGVVVDTNAKPGNKEAKFVRFATNLDIEKNKENKKKALELLEQTKVFAKDLNLKMKNFDAEMTLDEKKLIVYFTADGRVDFRELLKVMAGAFKKRIELHQVGPRDELQKLKSVGICGQECCCGKFLCDFNHVSIKMAKTQGLSLMPTNITGACGKLLCCLEYENNQYLQMQQEMPAIGTTVTTPDGNGEVVFNNLVKKIVEVKIGGEVKAFPLEKIKKE